MLQDELDLPFGEVKRKERGSARGHNGIRDIIARLNIDESPSLSDPIPSPDKGKKPKGEPKKRVDPNLLDCESELADPNLLPPLLAARPGLPTTDGCPRICYEEGKDVQIGPNRPMGTLPLSQIELESCQTSTGRRSVLDQVQALTLDWIRDRCQALTSPTLAAKPAAAAGREGGGATNGGGEASKVAKTSNVREKGEIVLRTDQFGVYRTVWVY